MALSVIKFSSTQRFMCLGMGTQYSPPMNNVVVIDIGHDIDFWGFMWETVVVLFLSQNSPFINLRFSFGKLPQLKVHR